MRQLKQLERLVAASWANGEDVYDLVQQIEDWQRLFEQAFEQGVAGFLHHQFCRLEVSLPAEVEEHIQQRLAIDRLWHRQAAADQARILSCLEQHDLQAVVLKGLVLAERVYPESTLRPVGDLDLLIDAAFQAEVVKALAPIGYSPRVFEAHETPPTHALVLKHANGGTVDLHHLASAGFSTTLSAAGLLERAESYRTVAGNRTWILSPEDELLYLAVHAARHRFTRLGWLVDLRLLLELQTGLRWPVVGDRAQGLGVRRAVTVALATLERSLRFRLPNSARSALPLDLRARLGQRLATVGVDSKPGGGSGRLFGVLWGHTYQALLGEGNLASFAYWLRALARSGRRLIDRRRPRI